MTGGSSPSPPSQDKNAFLSSVLGVSSPLPLPLPWSLCPVWTKVSPLPSWSSHPPMGMGAEMMGAHRAEWSLHPPTGTWGWGKRGHRAQWGEPRTQWPPLSKRHPRGEPQPGKAFILSFFSFVFSISTLKKKLLRDDLELFAKSAFYCHRKKAITVIPVAPHPSPCAFLAHSRFSASAPPACSSGLSGRPRPPGHCQGEKPLCPHCCPP